MIRPAAALTALILAGAGIALALPLATGGARGDLTLFAAAVIVLLLPLLSERRRQWQLLAAAGLGGLGVVLTLGAVTEGAPPAGFAGAVVAVWGLGWLLVYRLSALSPRAPALRLLLTLAIPAVFGIWVLYLWEVVVTALAVPAVLLPAPGAIAARFVQSTDLLWADFRQTFLKSVLAGFTLGCGSGFVVALLIDRSRFLQRGLLPIGNFVSALPIVGVAPIMVMWFGFDWPSKAAVVVAMTFFPMLVNTIAGLAASSAIDRDLMRTYAAGYTQTLLRLRLPQALPFVFNGLKINSTLALIGAIVAEFFGTPIVGMGFRISTEVGRLNLDMVWAEIALAALAGSLFYLALTLLERLVTFWHPSYRR